MFAAAATRTALAAVTISVLGAVSIVGAAGGAPGGKSDRIPPTSPENLHVLAATQSTVSVGWDPSWDDVAVSGYFVYGDGMRSRVSGTGYTIEHAECGQAVAIAVVAFDSSGNRSERVLATASTAPCSDTQPPSAPTGFRQSATTQNSVVLEWDPSADNVGVTRYGVFRSQLAVDSPVAPTVTLTGLTCDSSTEYQVDAVDAAGNRSARRSAWVRTAACSDAQPPTAPTNLTVTSRSETSVSLSWAPSTDNVAVAGYRVSVNGAPMGTGTQTSATIPALVCGRTYTVGVDAYDSAGNQSPAATLSTSTAACSAPPPPPPGDTNPPSQPTGLSVSGASVTSVSLDWAAAVDDVGVTSYGVYANGTSNQAVSQPGAMILNLACGTAYSFEVDASDAAGNRSPRSSLTASTAPCADAQPPTAPANVVTASRTASAIALAWSASTDNVGVTGYGLYRGGVHQANSPGATGIYSGLSCNTNYTLAVDAYDAAGNRSGKTTVMVGTTACPDSTPPSTPSGLAAANASQTGMTLSWSASTDNVGVTGYDVYRNATKVATELATSSVQSALTCGTPYTLGVVARDAAGNASAVAQLDAATTACSAPPPPSEWAFCANEGQLCSFSGTKDVRYGANGTFTAPRAFSAPVACTNTVFGDPIPGVSKRCEYRDASSTSPPPPPPSEWAFCANEGQLCSFSGTKDVRYGANGTFTAPRAFSAPVACTNTVFGDPIPGVVKRCEYRDGSSTSPPPPPPPTGGQALDDFADFKNNVWTQVFQRRWSDQTWSALDYVGVPWADGSGVFQVSTPHGPGFRIVQNEAVPRSSGALVGMADVDHFVDQQAYLGTVTELSGKIMFPATGNPKTSTQPTGFPPYGDWNVLWEWTQNTAVPNIFGVDALAPGGPTFYVRAFDPANPNEHNGRKVRASSPIIFDRWYDWRWQIKWSEGSDGYVNFWLDGQQIASFKGQSVRDSDGDPYLEWGWYGGYSAGRNEVLYAALRKS